ASSAAAYSPSAAKRSPHARAHRRGKAPIRSVPAAQPPTARAAAPATVTAWADARSRARPAGQCSLPFAGTGLAIQEPRPAHAGHDNRIAVFPVRPVIGRLWADPPIASEGVTRTGTRSIRGTFFRGPAPANPHLDPHHRIADGAHDHPAQDRCCGRRGRECDGSSPGGPSVFVA